METLRETLTRDFLAVRRVTLDLIASLEPDDVRVQPVEWVSPIWWTLGHTSWFIVKIVLELFGGSTDARDERFGTVLNSYYATFGPRHRRDRRGHLTRPTMHEILAYRASVDDRVLALIDQLDEAQLPAFQTDLTTALRHEQQHQELLLTEIKYLGWINPRVLRDPYRAVEMPELVGQPRALEFLDCPGGRFEVGYTGHDWSWDIERPPHSVWVELFSVASRTVTNAEFLGFIEDGGYRSELLWLSNGWAAVEREGWCAPLYWEEIDGVWHEWALTGFRPLRPHEPVTHVSRYEADAFARWKAATDDAFRGCRLPTEYEWERAARFLPATGWNTGVSKRLHPVPTLDGETHLVGNVWEWTASPFVVYPGYRSFPGPPGEYNGKFADGTQFVLRGGSCATFEPIRPSSRNFWPPDEQGRFQFTGIRLARHL